MTGPLAELSIPLHRMSCHAIDHLPILGLFAMK
jgi:hypothetical protein